MKKLLLILAVFCFFTDTFAQNWTWMSGSKLVETKAVYGIKGTPGAGNIPGSRFYSFSWKDKNGDLWLMGGSGYTRTFNGRINDLWRYNIATNLWTWMKGDSVALSPGIYGTIGSGDPVNSPGARQESLTWTDKQGNLWLFGGYGYDVAGNVGFLNDLWKYDVSTNNWTWMGGSKLINQAGIYGTSETASPSNIPGARNESISWVSADGALWLFGGYGYSSSASSLVFLNDLWKYDIQTGMWTWMSGSNFFEQYGTYGTLGTGSVSNYPGSRSSGVSWIDNNGDFWLFGGYGNGVSGNTNRLNDLWKYSPTTKAWTWVKGSNAINQAGTYGTKGIPSASNVPGARNFTVAWTDAQNNLWLMGGWGNAYTVGATYLNDLWKYSISDGTWTWMKGNNGSQPGVYGTQGITSSTNTPGSRYAACSWIDNSNRLWVMGGFATDENGFTAQINDLWKYDIAVPTGINEQRTNRSYSVYPNPAGNIITVSSGLSDNKSEYTISDLTGKIVKRGFITGELSQVDISNIRTGIYIMQLGTGEKSETVRIIKK